MRTPIASAIAVSAAFLLPIPADARNEAPRSEPPSALLSAVARCVEIQAPDARLACYDKAGPALVHAEAQREVVVVDQAQMKETKKRLFGMNLSISPLFANTPDVDSVETTLQSASFVQGAGWTFQLADGATWAQTDGNPVPGKPKAGEKVVVRRATLGAFKLTLGSRPGVKVRRVN